MLNKVTQSLKEVTVKVIENKEYKEYKITPTRESRLGKKLFFKPKDSNTKCCVIV